MTESNKAEKAAVTAAAIGTIWFGLFILLPLAFVFIFIIGAFFASL